MVVNYPPMSSVDLAFPISDEQLLKRPEHQQKVAEGIYQGVASYLQSLNSVTVNLPPRLPSGKADDPSKVRPVEQSRNQN